MAGVGAVFVHHSVAEADIHRAWVGAPFATCGDDRFSVGRGQARL